MLRCHLMAIISVSRGAQDARDMLVILVGRVEVVTMPCDTSKTEPTPVGWKVIQLNLFRFAVLHVET